MKNEPRIQSYSEFWPFYLAEHSKKSTKVLHFVGTLIGVIAVFTSVHFGYRMGVVYAICFAYGVAWFSHFFVERNRPATFRYPLWSFMSDFRMMWWLLLGKFKQNN